MAGRVVRRGLRRRRAVRCRRRRWPTCSERGLSHLPAVRARLGRADAQVAAARLVVREAARRVDTDPGDARDEPLGLAGEAAAGETAMEVAASMLEAAGTSATRGAIPLERLFRDARCGSLQPATSRRVRRLARHDARSASTPTAAAGSRDGDRTHRGCRATPSPAAWTSGELWDGFFEQHYAGNRTARRVWSSSGVSTRHGVVDPRDEDV